MTDDELRARICANCGSLDVQHAADTSCIWDGEFNRSSVGVGNKLTLPWPSNNAAGAIWAACRANAIAYLSRREPLEQWGDLITIQDKPREPECKCDMRDLMSQGHSNLCAWRKT